MESEAGNHKCMARAQGYQCVVCGSQQVETFHTHGGEYGYCPACRAYVDVEQRRCYEQLHHWTGLYVVKMQRT